MTAALLLAFVTLAAGIPAVASSRAFDLNLDAPRPSRAPVFAVEQDDDVALRVESENAVDVHLHGYDIAVTASKTKPATIRFVARASGRFPIEVHRKDGHRVVGYVEVRPR